MTPAQAITLAHRIARDFERADLVLPLMECEQGPDGSVPYIDLYDVNTKQRVGRIFSEAEYTHLLTHAKAIAKDMTLA